MKNFISLMQNVFGRLKRSRSRLTKMMLLLLISVPVIAADAITVTGSGTQIAGYWNSTSSGATISFDVPDDSGVEFYQIKAKATTSGVWDTPVLWTSIAPGEINTTKVTALTNGQMEGVDDFAEGALLEFKVVFGNGGQIALDAYDATLSPQIRVYNELPATGTTGSVNTTGGSVYSSRWNDTNTGVQVTTPIPNDEALQDGSLQIQAYGSGSGSWVNVGSSALISSINTNQSISINGGDITGLAGYGDGNTIHFRSVVTDIAGNADVSYNESGTTLLVDLTSPAAFSTGTVTTLGGNFKTGYWNSSNTDVTVVVTVPSSDATLINGQIQVQAKIDDGSFANVGSAVSISGAGDETITIPRSQFDDLPYGTNSVVSFRGVITDNAGNSTNGSTSGSTLTVDEARPAISDVSSTTSYATTKVEDDIILIDVTFDKNVTLSGGNIVVTLETGTTDRALTFTGPLSTANEFQVSYQVNAGEESSDLNVKSISLTAGSLLDVNGNDADFSTLPASNLASDHGFVIDAIGPSIDHITASTANGFYGQGQTIAIEIHFSENVNMSSGSLDVELETSASGTDRTIQVPFGEINNTSVVNVSYEVQAGESTTDLKVNSVSETDGTLIDGVGTRADLTSLGTNLDANKNIEIDTDFPATVTVGAVVTDQGVVVPGKWNSGNRNVKVTLDLPTNDATLINGTALIYGSVNGGTFSSIGSATTLLAGGETIITLTESDFEDDLSISDNQIITFTADITDRAGNTQRWGTSATSLTIDQAIPYVVSVTSDPEIDILEESDNAVISVTFDQDIDVGGSILSMHLNTGTGRTLTASETSPGVFTATYTVLAGEQATVLDVSYLSQTGSLRDASGNPATITIPDDEELRDNSTLEVDAVAPTISQIRTSDGNGPFGVDRSLNIQIYFNEPVVLANGNMILTLETGSTDRTVEIEPFSLNQYPYATYVVQAGETSNALEVLSITLEDGATLQDARSNDATLTIPANENLDDNNAVVIETDPPADFTVGTVIPSGDPVVSGYWNDANTHLLVTVPIDDDATLQGGNIQLRAKVGGSAYGNLGNAVNIPNTDLLQEVSIDAETFEGLGFAETNTITIAAIITDNAGNTTTGSPSTNQIVIDQDVPTITSVTSVPIESTLKLGESAEITVLFSENVTLTGGNIVTTLETHATDPDREIITGTHTNSDSYTFSYSVLPGEENTDLNVQEIALSGGYIRDDAGNDVDLDLPADNNLANNSALNADGVLPEDFTVGTVIAEGNNVVDDYWNSTNTSLSVSVPIADDSSLPLGTIQLKALVSGGSYQDLGEAVTILAKNTTQEIDITKIVFEGLEEFNDNKTVTIKAVITDVVGNEKEGSPSLNVITVDRNIPTILEINSTPSDDDLTIGESVNIEVTFSEQVNLSVDGVLTTNLNTGGDGTDLTTGTFSASSTYDEDYTVQSGDDQDVLNVASISLASGTIRDAAGNDVNLDLPPGDNLANNSTISVDGIIPSITSITTDAIDGHYGVGGEIYVTLTFNEALTMASGDFLVTLETGGSDHVLNFGQFTDETSVTKKYTVEEGEVSGDLTVKSITLSGVGTLRDAVLYDANLALPADANLADAHALVIDGVYPSDFTTGDIVTLGSVINTTYWNSTNTSITVTVPIANDTSLVNGDLQIVGRTDPGNEYETLGDAETIPTKGVSQEISIEADDIELLEGFDENSTLYISAIINDLAGNPKTGTASSIQLVVDQEAPTIISMTSDPVTGQLGLGAEIDVTINFSENVILSGDVLVTTFETGSSDRSVTTPSLLNVDTYEVTYEVQEGDFTDNLQVLALSVQGSGTLRDVAGNDAVLTVNAGNNLSSDDIVSVDGSIPNEFTVSSIVTSGGVVSDGYWNESNTQLMINVPIENDPSLAGGTIYIQAQVGGNPLDTLGSGVTIPISNTTQTVEISDVVFEDLDNLSEGSVITFNAIIADAVGNSRLGNASATTITVDRVSPELSSFLSDPLNDNMSVGESADVSIVFDEPVKLVGGNMIVTFDTDAEYTIAPFDYFTNDTTVNYIVVDGEESADLNVTEIRLTSGSLRDAAGNDVVATGLVIDIGATDSLSENSALEVDGVVPTITGITSDSDDSEYYSFDESLSFTIAFSEPVELSAGNIIVGLEGVGNDINISSITDDTTIVVSYTVAAGDASDDLSVTTPLTLSVADSFTDPAGNNVNLAIVAGNNLSANYNFVVDGTGPADFTVGTVTATEGNVVDGYYNSSNTGVRVTVPLVADQSLQFGEVQVQAKVGENTFENVGDPSRIQSVPGSKNIELSSNDLRGLEGYDQGGLITFTAVITDSVGNSTLGTASTDIITVDTTNPGISEFTSVLATDNLSIGESAAVTIAFDEPVKLENGNMVLTFDTGTQYTITSYDYLTSDTTVSYSVSADEESSDLNVMSVELIAATLRDEAGNDVVATGTFIDIGATDSLAENSALTVDGVVPTITGITSDSDDSEYYSFDESLSFTIVFSEPVELSSGNIIVGLEGVGNDINISSITDDTTIVVSYTVADADASDDLRVTTPLTLSDLNSFKDPAGNNVNLAIPEGSNLDDNYTFVVDGTGPADFTVGTVLATEGNVVDGYYNSSNTGVRVTVPIATDQSLQYGEVQVQARVGENSYENIGAPSRIQSVPGSKNIDLSPAEIRGIAGFDQGVLITFNAVISDSVGNSTLGTASEDIITVDTTSPGLIAFSSTPVAADLGLGESAAVKINFDEPVKLVGGNMLITFDTDNGILMEPFDAFYDNRTANYNVIAGESSPDLNITSIELIAATLRDIAGNDIIATGNFLDISVGDSLAENSAITVDGIIPIITTVTSTSDDTEYYKLDESIEITVAFSEPVVLSGGIDLSLVGATTDWSGYSVTDDTTIVVTYHVGVGDESSDLSIGNSQILLQGGSTLKDLNGNDVDLNIPAGQNLDDNYTFVVDGVVPDDFTVGTVIASDFNIETGYYNSTNTSIDVAVPINADGSLEGGTVQLRARVSVNNFQDIGDPGIITTLDTDKIIQVDSALVNALPGFSENLGITFNAVITDSVGNSTTGTESADILTIDHTIPEISQITSDPVIDALSIGESADIIVEFSEAVTLDGGNLTLTFDTGAEIIVTTLAGLDNFTETYIAATDETSDDLDITSIALTGTLRDAAGNDVLAELTELTLPPGETLAENSGLFIDGDVPSIASISSPTTADSIKLGETISIDVEFSEPVTLSGGNILLTLETGDLVADQELQITPFIEQTTVSVDYIVVVDHETPDLTVSAITLSGGTLIDPSGNPVDYSVPLLTNLGDNNQILVDGIVPDTLDTGDILTLGDPVVENYWNLLNDSLGVTIPIDGTDQSMDGGIAFLQARIDTRPFETIGDTIDVGTNPVTLWLERLELESLAGYLIGDSIEVRGVITDIAGNSTIANSSANKLAIDIIAPTSTETADITTSGGTRVSGYWNTTNLFVVIGTLLESDNSLVGGTLQLEADINSAGSWANIGQDSIITTVGVPLEITLDYTDLTTFGAGDGNEVTFRAVLTDKAGNETTGTEGPNSLIIDITAPTAVQVENPVATGDPIVANYFNINNTGLDVSIPIEADATLIGGSIQFAPHIDGVIQATYGEITIVDYNPVTQSPSKSALEELPDYADDVEITFNATITDVAGNETTALFNPNPVVVDLTAPIANAFNIVQPQGGIEQTGYWNASNDTLLITVVMDNGDVTLQNGFIQASGNLLPGDGTFETFPTVQGYPALSATNTIKIPADEIESLDAGTGFVDGLDIELRTIITDAAGNSTTSPTSTVTLEIDQTPPVTPVITETIITGINVTQGVWNSGADSIFIDLPIDSDSDPTLVGGFYEVLMSVGASFDENPYENVGEAQYDIPAEDTLRFGNLDITGITNFADLDTLYTQFIIQDRAGNQITTPTSDERIYIDIGPPIDFECGPLTAVGGVVVENSFNNTNVDVSLKVPIDNDNGLIGGQAIFLVSLIDLEVDPFAASSFEEIDSVIIDAGVLGDTLEMILDVTDLSGLTEFRHNVRMEATAILQDAAGNETQGTPRPNNKLDLDFIGPELPVLNDTTTTGGNVVDGFWNVSNSGINMVVATPTLSDTTLEGGYIQILGLVGSESSFEEIGDPVPIVSRNFTEVTASIDSTIIEYMTGFGEFLPLHLRVKMVDGRGNDTIGIRMDTLFWVDQIAPTIGTFDPLATTQDPFINDEDTLKASWQGFVDAHDQTSIANYEFSIGNTAGLDDFLAWDTLSGTQLDTLMTYTHADEYYLNVRAIDEAGNVSEILSHSTITADLILPEADSDMERFYFIEDWPDTLSGSYSDDLSGVDSVWLGLKRVSDEYYWSDEEGQWVFNEVLLEMDIAENRWEHRFVSDSLANREEYTINLFTRDSAGNYAPPVLAEIDTFQFVINTAPLFADRETYQDSTLEDSLYARIYEVIDPDVGSLSADTLFYSLDSLAPVGVDIDSLTGELTWLPVDSAVGDHSFKLFVVDAYGEEDSMEVEFKVIEVNDAPEPVTLLLPADSTQMVAADSLLLTFTWTNAFDIEDNEVDYIVGMNAPGYDTTITALDTFLTVDVSVMDFPNGMISWFVKGYDQEDTSAVSDTFHVASSPAFAELNTDTVEVRLQRYTNIDTTLIIRNLGLTDLRWSFVDGPDWLTLDDETGTVAFQDSSIVGLNVNPSAFTVGEFKSAFRFATNDPLQDTITVSLVLGVYDIPNPVLAFYKNPAYPGFYELMVVDSLGMTDSLTITYLGEDLEITTIDTFSYMATIEVESQGLQSFELVASNWVGDTTLTTSVNVSLARSGSQWVARSPDDEFEVAGGAYSMEGTAKVVVLDSLLSASEDARYKVLGDGQKLAEPVLVSMPLNQGEEAIYILNEKDEYIELPSLSNGERVTAWSERFGAYKLGPRTIIVPEKSQLSQNYPNPFNPSTTIEFDIGFMDGLNQDIEFHIYNIRGQQVKTLMDAHLQPGSYSLTWNGLDDYGKQVSSGIYLARLMTGKGYVKTVKMLILR